MQKPAAPAEMVLKFSIAKYCDNMLSGAKEGKELETKRNQQRKRRTILIQLSQCAQKYLELRLSDAVFDVENARERILQSTK